jgi:hypothetical protein
LPRTPPQHVPLSDWPAWAKLVSLDSAPEDAGVGDTVKRMTGQPGDWYVKLRKAIGLPCRCPERQQEWNVLYPYPKESSQVATPQRR